MGSASCRSTSIVRSPKPSSRNAMCVRWGRGRPLRLVGHVRSRWRPSLTDRPCAQKTPPPPTTEAPPLPGLTEQDRAALDYRITGIPTGPQVMRFYRERLSARGVRSTADLSRGAHGAAVTVAGAMVVKQHPETAKGHVFLSLEDEYGLANIIIRPATYAKYKPVVDLGGAVVVEGTLQHVDGVVSVLARRLDELTLFVKLASHDWQ